MIMYMKIKSTTGEDLKINTLHGSQLVTFAQNGLL